jgi:carboxyl-terminal processing protease
MVPVPRLLSRAACVALALAAVARGQSPSDAGNAAADRLWRSFLAKYDEFSLKPLDPALLDKKAREALIANAGPKFATWKPDDHPDLPALADAVVARDAAVSKFDRIESALEELLPQIDTYGHYRRAADVAQWLEALRQNPGSVHMTLEQSEDGRTLCYPLESGPAETAGIHSGAELLAVDGRSAKGRTLSALRLAFVGPPHTPIRLEVRQPQGKIEEFSVERTDKPSPNISVTKSPVGLTLRIRKFSPGSALAVKQQLEPYPKPGRLTIDLRGNPGGLRDEALKIASLFFPEGTPLGKFVTKSGEQLANDGNAIFVEANSIRILQDGRTASAAEYLVATLKEGLPDKVVLFGSKTYGKSHSTVHVMLEGGGELAVTEALLSTASGSTWEKSGVLPDQGGK